MLINKIMILGKKHVEYTDYVEPTREEYSSIEDYSIAKAQYTVRNLVPFEKTTLKKEVTGRYKNVNLKIGKTVFIKRWDDNGIDKKSEIIDIIWDKVFPKIICEDGYFVFNPNKEYNTFHWKGKGKSWEKKYQKWIKTSNYYIEKL